MAKAEEEYYDPELRALRQQEGTMAIYQRQVIALCHKNLKLFLRRPLVLLFRVLLAPIVVALILTEFKHVGSSGGFGPDTGGVSDLRPIKSIAAAMEDHEDTKIVFATNGLGSHVNPIIDRFISRTKVSNVVRVDNPADILKECQVNLAGASECFSTIIFNKANGSFVDYIIANNPADLAGSVNWRSHKSVTQDRVLPVQFAMDSAIANLPESTVVQEQSYSEDTSYYYNYYSSSGDSSNSKTSSGEVGTANPNQYYFILTALLAPFFFIIFIEMVFHVCGFLTRERESGVTELLTTQGCRQTPQIVSYFSSFWILYVPTWIFTGIIVGVVLFPSTNAGFLILFQLLAGTATLSMCLFLQTPFTKGHFSSPVAAIVTLALAMIFFKYMTDPNPSDQTTRTGLAAVFPPFAYASLIADLGRLESITLGYRPSRSAADLKILTDYPSMEPYLYIIFFLIQIPLYLTLAVGSHFSLWHVPYIVKRLAPETGLAMRITGLKKTFKKNKAVNDLSMEVKAGQVVCLLGPNGGGKTTTLKCIGGVIKADKGSGMELGCDRTELGYCPQHNVIWPQLTVREHVQIWLEIKGRKMPKAERDAMVEAMVRECDLIEKIDGKAFNLSGGQKRKLQLAIAFIGGSKIICIDEASSGVDPLSRQNIWQIIQQGVAHRTILLTTHFLDEADILSDYIVIIRKGQLVVEGSGTALKAQYGDGYSIYDDHTLTNKVGHAKTSCEAAQRLEELEKADVGTGVGKYEVAFPTLEQVFLKVANGESLDEEREESEGAEEGAQSTLENPARQLDQGRPISKFRQIWVLFKKRYSVLPHNWLSIIITLAIPIAVTVALMTGGGSGENKKFTGGIHDCAYQVAQFQSESSDINSSAALSRSEAATRQPTPTASAASATKTANYYDTPISDYPPFYEPLSSGRVNHMYIQDQLVVGPQAEFKNGSDNYKLLDNIFPDVTTYSYDGSPAPPLSNSLLYVNNQDNYTKTLPLGGSGNSKQIGIWAPQGQTPIIALSNSVIDLSYDYATFYGVDTLSVVSNILSRNNRGPTIRAAVRKLRGVGKETDFLAIGWSLFFAMATICGFTACIIYPTYERVQRTRALQYSNGVRPISLWSAYMLFELQLILLVAIVMYAILSVGSYTKMFFGLGYIFGAIILTGVATTLGCFVLSLYFSAKLAYVMAAIIHLFLLFLYLVGVILIQQYGPAIHRFDMANQLSAGLSLTSPGANLFRAFMLATNSYSVLCGDFGDVLEPNKFAFNLYGGVYFNLILQIVFLVSVLMAFEYSIFSRIYYRLRNPTRSRARDSMEVELRSVANKAGVRTSEEMRPLLECFGVHKSFNGVEAVQDVTLSVSSNETMALLGPNGAGKSTTINMIRGELKPDSGDIFVRDKSILTNLVEARAETGVCPQDDATDDLTVFTTLKFYAEVRGVPHPAKNAQLAMEALGIQDFKDKRVTKLSGGTKRKLSVAIALLGNPPVLLLDEPSTGLDAVSKRTLWKTLKALGKDRSTLLTTHSMEEVEALATSVSIIAMRLLASGTTSSLRDQYGGFWHVRAIVDQSQASMIERYIRNVFGNSVEEYATQGSSGQIRFALKKGGRGVTFASAMKEMEKFKGDGAILEYSINGTTLQEVFLNVCGKEKSSK
ncbi:hypothetical protein H072_10711 [Dactylellina haptotyla CBS 200.50]|uniref:ABC transporter domain-containing protein n=1 Tax=Dactylellina haptotyla (strain CBS 200.50) TaxID=1284197 RepID=S8BKI0_DACHA|nr:hypothetical protein H072_10711 [Dactylellina haptotyla CBS 200.50]